MELFQQGTAIPVCRGMDYYIFSKQVELSLPVCPFRGRLVLSGMYQLHKSATAGKTAGIIPFK